MLGEPAYIASICVLFSTSTLIRGQAALRSAAGLNVSNCVLSLTTTISLVRVLKSEGNISLGIPRRPVFQDCVDNLLFELVVV